MELKMAKRMIKEVDKARVDYRQHYCKNVRNVFTGYDLMIDSSKFGVDGTAYMLSDIAKNTFLI